MKRFIALLLSGFLLATLLMVFSVSACTIFSISYGQKVFFAGNEDEVPQNSASWLLVDKIGHYGIVAFQTPWPPWPFVMQTGINEKGLCYDGNSIPDEKLNPHPERIWRSTNPAYILMRECATVEEVVATYQKYDWSRLYNGKIDTQVHFADRTGDAVIIYPGKDGEVTHVRKPRKNSYLVSANFNVRLMQEGDFSKSMSWVGWDRYNTADKMLARIKSEKDLNVKTLASVLEAVRQPDGSRTLTVYSELYDLQNMRIYLFYNHQFDTAYVLDVAEELAKTKGSFRRVPLKDLILDPDVKKEKMQ